MNGGGYFDLKDILSKQHRVSCRLKKPCKDLGFIANDRAGRNLPENFKLDLPFWLAEPLHTVEN